jgi:hypothetical protein
VPLLISSIQAGAVPVILLAFRLGNAQNDLELQLPRRPSLETKQITQQLQRAQREGGAENVPDDDDHSRWPTHYIGRCWPSPMDPEEILWKGEMAREGAKTKLIFQDLSGAVFHVINGKRGPHWAARGCLIG